MQIAKLKQKDIPGYSKLAKKIILESPYYSDLAKKESLHDFQINKIKKDIKDKTILLIDAKNSETQIGFIRGFFEAGISSGIFWLQWIGVDTNYRRSGVADKMLEHLKKNLTKSYGSHKIACVTRPSNTASINLFKRNKYQDLILLEKHWYKEDFMLWYKYL